MEKSIYLLGDIGYFNNHTYNIFKTINNDSKFGDSLILVGDNFYPDGVINESDKLWEKIKNSNIKLPIYPILGNHDHLGNPYAQIRHRSKDYNWNFPYFYYKLNFYNYDFFLIDTCFIQPNYSNVNENTMRQKIVNFDNERKEMMKWLEYGLSKSKNNKIVIGHYPLISLGVYGINEELFSSLIDLFEKYNVKMYISGHDHNLQIHTIKNNCTNYMLKHLISGAGSGIYEHRSFPYNDNDNIFFKNGFIKLSLTQSSDKINITFVDEFGEKIHTEVV